LVSVGTRENIHRYKISVITGYPKLEFIISVVREFGDHWEDRDVDIRMDLSEIGWDIVDWIGVAQDRGQWRTLVNTVLNLRVP
jgi:hypothetical protein